MICHVVDHAYRSYFSAIGTLERVAFLNFNCDVNFTGSHPSHYLR